MARAKNKAVEKYINSKPPRAQKRLRLLQKVLLSAAPSASEELKWGMPALSDGKILVVYGAFKNHIGFYPTAKAIAAFSRELSGFKGARGSVQFPFDQEFPLALVRKIIKFRVKENRKVNSKWKDGAASAKKK